jgi:hydroxypyruvate reductase
MLAAARALAADSEPARLVALISGGGSALAELPRQLGLAELQAFYRDLVGCGAPIAAMNVIRKHASRFKGGQLAAAAGGAVEQWTLVLSDVAGDDLSQVASGPTLPDPSSQADAERLVRQWLPQHSLQLGETPKPTSGVFARSQCHTLATNADVCRCAAELATGEGYAPVVVDASADEWECAPAAEYLSARWRELRARHARPCLIAGGEVRVRLPPSPGTGGRNQQLALTVAGILQGQPFQFLSAGTDGVDGSSHAAGALVDGTTWARARRLGHDPRRALALFDATPLLEAIGDLVVTGPTSNNLRDLRVFI